MLRRYVPRVWLAFIELALSSALVLALVTSGDAGRTLSAQSSSFPAIGDEFVGPFENWMNLKTKFGAKGDGTADDTGAIQAALDALGSGGTTGYVLYVPAGMYKITQKLIYYKREFTSILGEDPTATIFKWMGAADDTMLAVDGVAYTRISRITFDGSSLAGVLIDQSGVTAGGFFDTGNEYADDTFKDARIGVQCGVNANGCAEGTIIRSHFSRLSQFGILLGNFNALDLWVRYSTFDDNAMGISNVPGAGNFHAYNNVFHRSAIADIKIGNTGGFSFRSNYSISSNIFIDASGTNNPASITLQGNTVLDTRNTQSIHIGNQGPVFMYDNIIRSLSGGPTMIPVLTGGHTGSPVFVGSFSDSDAIAVGNRFTAGNAKVAVKGRLLEIDSTVRSSSSIHPADPVLPPTEPNVHRKVFDVSATATGAEIQEAIDNAGAENGHRPVVHIPAGDHFITSTLIIEANTDVQLAGDGYRTRLVWKGTGAGPVLWLQGPSKATIRELDVDGGSLVEGIVGSNIDQRNSRVFMHGTMVSGGAKTNLFADALDFTSVEAEDFGHSNQSTGVGVRVRGGPLAAAGSPQAGEVKIYSGASSGEILPYEVSNGGTLLVRDVWYEGSPSPAFLHSYGEANTTLEGLRVALEVNNRATPGISIENLQGKLSVLNVMADDRIIVSGNGSKAQVLGLGYVGRTVTPYLFNLANPTAAAGLVLSRQLTNSLPGMGTIATSNQGITDPGFVKSMLAQTRAAVQSPIAGLPNGVTDLRLYRVWVTGGINGIHLYGVMPSKESTH
jgi:Pectate lyase superfamily protein